VLIPYNVTLRGEGKGEFLAKYGASTIHSVFGGKAILVKEGRYGWSIRDLAITGDTSLASQDLLTIGEGNTASDGCATTTGRMAWRAHTGN